MDAEMREKITMGMMVGCLVLALVAMFTTSWLTGDDDTTMSLTKMYAEADSKEECEMMADM